jgi:uncharacterized protein YkwD
MFKPSAISLKIEGSLLSATIGKGKELFYSFRVGRSSLTASLTSNKGTARLEILNKSGTSIAPSNKLIDTNLKAGTYYIKISSPKKTSFSLFTNKGGRVSNPIELDTIHETNLFRVSNNLTPLVNNTKLQAIAYSHSYRMGIEDFFSHTYQGTSSGDRADRAGYNWSLIAENIAAGQTTPKEVVQAWIDSPGHRANLVRPQLRDIGIGYFFLREDVGKINYNHYWTQDLGTTL